MDGTMLHMDQKWYRVLRITSAPKNRQNLVGRYLTKRGAWLPKKVHVDKDGVIYDDDSLWTSCNIDDAYQYHKGPEVEMIIQYDRKLYRSHKIGTTVVLVRQCINAFDMGKGGLSGDYIRSYITGIKDGRQVWLKRYKLQSQVSRKSIKLDGHQVGFDYSSLDFYMFRGYPSDEVLIKIQGLADKDGITNLTLGRCYPYYKERTLRVAL